MNNNTLFIQAYIFSTHNLQNYNVELILKLDKPFLVRLLKSTFLIL